VPPEEELLLDEELLEEDELLDEELLLPLLLEDELLASPPLEEVLAEGSLLGVMSPPQAASNAALASNNVVGYLRRTIVARTRHRRAAGLAVLHDVNCICSRSLIAHSKTIAPECRSVGPRVWQLQYARFH
jgi:hypothetical protein